MTAETTPLRWVGGSQRVLAQLRLLAPLDLSAWRIWDLHAGAASAVTSWDIAPRSTVLRERCIALVALYEGVLRGYGRRIDCAHVLPSWAPTRPAAAGYALRAALATDLVRGEAEEDPRRLCRDPVTWWRLVALLDTVRGGLWRVDPAGALTSAIDPGRVMAWTERGRAERWAAWAEHLRLRLARVEFVQEHRVTRPASESTPLLVLSDPPFQADPLTSRIAQPWIPAAARWSANSHEEHLEDLGTLRDEGAYIIHQAHRAEFGFLEVRHVHDSAEAFRASGGDGRPGWHLVTLRGERLACMRTRRPSDEVALVGVPGEVIYVG